MARMVYVMIHVIGYDHWDSKGMYNLERFDPQRVLGEGQRTIASASNPRELAHRCVMGGLVDLSNMDEITTIPANMIKFSEGVGGYGFKLAPVSMSDLEAFHQTYTEERFAMNERRQAQLSLPALSRER